MPCGTISKTTLLLYCDSWEYWIRIVHSRHLAISQVQPSVSKLNGKSILSRSNKIMVRKLTSKNAIMPMEWETPCKAVKFIVDTHSRANGTGRMKKGYTQKSERISIFDWVMQRPAVLFFIWPVANVLSFTTHHRIGELMLMTCEQFDWMLSKTWMWSRVTWLIHNVSFSQESTKSMQSTFDILNCFISRTITFTQIFLIELFFCKHIDKHWSNPWVSYDKRRSCVFLPLYFFILI